MTRRGHNTGLGTGRGRNGAGGMAARPGFTLMEIVIVIAIILLLTALLVPVFVRAVGQTRQAACLNNQRQIAMNLLMAVQDNDGMFPSVETVWETAATAPKLLVCPAAGRLKRNAYAYNALLADMQQNQVQLPDETFLITDGHHVVNKEANGLESANAAYTPADFAYRHGNKLVASYVDGHVDVRTYLSFMPRLNMIDNASMVYVPAGPFVMGGGGTGEIERTVYLDAFWIYKFEVTVGQYRRFCEQTKHPFPKTPPTWGWHDIHPMVNITWDDAQAYAEWAGVKLPTEAQWEKTARALDGNLYPWADQRRDPNRLNCLEDDLGRKEGAHLMGTTPVGSYPLGASPYGAMDLAGNVWEFCADWYAAIPTSNAAIKNPTGPETGEFHVMRGGSFSSAFKTIRAPERRLTEQDVRDDCGFRCVYVP